MKLRSRITAILGGLTLAVSAGMVTAIPASAITTRSIISYEGFGAYLTTCGNVASGDNVGFNNNANCKAVDSVWDFQLEGGSGTSKYYYLHPGGYDSLCMTASTTQYGVIKIENCVSADQQYWFDTTPSGYDTYHIYNDYWGAYLYQTENDTTGLTGSCSYAYNSCTFEQ